MKSIIFKIASGSLLTLAVVGSAQAQTLEGKLMRTSQFGTTDMVNLSQYNYGFGTARSTAMGGAFTSLGADLSSMSINPAGLGMYRGSEFGVTMSVIGSNTDSKVEGGYSRLNNKTKFGFNNVSVALNMYQGVGALTSFTLGFGYNKLADFNYNTGVRLADDKSSLNEVFFYQAQGIGHSTMGGSYPYNETNELDWGAVLAYKTGILTPKDGTTDQYNMPDWDINVNTTHFLRTNNRGGINEYTLSGGMNFSNIVYLGFTLGMQDIYYHQTDYYDEQYIGTPYSMNYMLYDQSVRYSGSAVNFKLGAIIRPAEGLRIGLAVHTPSYVSLERQYNGSMSVDYSRSEKPDPDNPGGVIVSPAETVNRYTNNLISQSKFNSPTRLLTGISYTMPDVGILSVDYERVWYNGMRLGHDVDADIREEWKWEVKDQFKGSNNIRVGMEIKPTQNFSIRGGYAHYGSMMKDDNRVLFQPISAKGYNVSTGIGYRYQNMNIDFTYVYMNSTLTAYDLYYYKNGTDEVSNPSYIETTRTRNNFALSLGLRF